MSELHALGPTQQALLRHLLQHPHAGVESLCERLRISHNAVRQHLTALIGKGWVERCQSQPSGGRPLAQFRLTPQARELFPRNYARIATALLEGMADRLGGDGVNELLVALGRQLGATESLDHDAAKADLATQLAERLDALGYEAVPTQRGGETEVEAFNCVFHAMAQRNPNVCKFDLAYMEAATGHRIHHMECIVRGGHVCRFRIGDRTQTPETSVDDTT